LHVLMVFVFIAVAPGHTDAVHAIICSIVQATKFTYL
jgi:hypothetical protein